MGNSQDQDIEAQHRGRLLDSEVPKLQPSSSGQQADHDNSALGLALYAISSCFLSTALVFAKKLSHWHMPVFEILMARSSTIMCFALIGCAWKGITPFGHRRGLLLVRGIFGFGAIGNYFFAVSLLPLNDALVLTFTAPIWASILGPFFIKETPQKAVGFAIVLCMLGTVFITQPSVLGFEKNERSLLGVGFALFQALCSACAKMLVRELRTESPFVSVFYLSACSLIASVFGTGIPKALGWQNAIRLPNGWVEWSFMLGVGIASWGSQICMTNALRFARAAPALAMSYLSVIITGVYGYFFFHEVPTKWSLLGSTLILSSTLMMGVFERKKDRQIEDQPVQEDSEGERSAGYTALGTGPATPRIDWQNASDQK